MVILALVPYGRNCRERVVTVVTCRDTLATVSDSYNSVAEIGLSYISTTVATG